MSMFRSFENFTFRGYFARKAFDHICHSYDNMLPTGMRATVTNHIKADTDCAIQNGAFGLRYKEMVTAKKPNSPFPPDHYCVHRGANKTMLFHDMCDFYPSTFHINMWKHDTVKASSRYVDGKYEKLEMESFGWYDLRKEHPELGDNFVEPSRVVACKTVRGSAMVPLMYLRWNIEAVNRGVGTMIGTVNARSMKLLSHYKNWAKWDILAKEPIETNEFIPGNTCVVLSQQISKAGDESDHIIFIIIPTYIVCRVMIVRDRFMGLFG